MKPWQRKQADSRRSLRKKVAQTFAFGPDELAAIAHEMRVEEPGPQHIRRFIAQAVDARLTASRRNLDDSRTAEQVTPY